MASAETVRATDQDKTQTTVTTLTMEQKNNKSEAKKDLAPLAVENNSSELTKTEEPSDGGNKEPSLAQNKVTEEQQNAADGDKDSITSKNNGSSEGVDTVAVAYQLLSTGKRHLACDDFLQAVETLAESCQLLTEEFGDQGHEVAEAYYYYGKSLLELARMENGVLGNALDGVAPEEENEADLSETDQFEKASTLPDGERETIVAEVYSAMAADEKEEIKSTNEETDKPAEDAETKEDQRSEETKEECEEVQESTESVDEEAESVGEEMEEGAGSSQDGEEEADDVPNLQLAWEILELAKRIYLQRKDVEKCDKTLKDIKMRLSDVYRVLGEVSLETGTYEQAIQDITSSLEWESACVGADDRAIAETHYLLGNAYLFNRDYKLAVEQLRKTKSIIETRISNLDACQDADGKERREKERNELQALLPDVIAKVEDVEDECREAQRAESEVKAVLTKSCAGTTTIGFGNASSDGAAASTIATKANDISNLVRKRKPEEQGGEEMKKAKQEVVNGGGGDKENGAMKVSSGDQ